MKLWKRIAALCVSVSTMGISMFSAGCDISGAIGGQSGSFISNSQGNSVESSLGDSSSEIHTHEWTEVVVKAATCTEDGKKVLKCDCGEEKDEEVIPAGHSIVTHREANATCQQVGIVRVFCENCEYEEYREEEQKEHMFLFGGECFWCGKTREEIENEQNPPSPPSPPSGLESGFWAELSENSVGGGMNTDYSGDFTIEGDPMAIPAYDFSPVTVKFYHTMGAKLRDVLDTWIPVFNAMYPNITIVHESQGDYPGLRDRIATEIRAGDSPNLAYCYPDHVALYNKAGVVATLDDYIASTAVVTRSDGTTETMGFSQAELNEFVRAYLEEGRAYGNGKMYTLPYSKSTEVLYYNKTFFEANNLTVPTTWDEMETLIQQIAVIDERCVPLGYDSEANWFITMSQQLGTPYTSAVEGEKFLFDVETNQAFVGRLREWYKNGYVTTEETYGSYTSDLFVETEPERLKCYMVIGSSAGASYQCPDPYTDENGETAYPFEVGVAQIPQINPANPKVSSQGPSLCMFKKNDPQEMAATWLFMKFLTTHLGLQADFSVNSGYAPVVKDLGKKVTGYAVELNHADGNRYLQMTVIKQCLAQEDAMFATPAFVGSSAARDEVGVLMQSCFVNHPVNGQSVADFIKEVFSDSIERLQYDYGA